VAALAEQFFVLAVRRWGNMLGVLRDELSLNPKVTWVFSHPRTVPETEGNAAILATFPLSARVFPQGASQRPVPALEIQADPAPDLESSHTMAPPPNAFLFHYTRSCPGPWPGQSRCAWALDLLHAAPWADHTARDTLWRILSERRLRACGRLIRRGVPVVSWTPVPPHELARLIRWNPALIRWTFEPYGIAVKKEVLKKRGARPVIYATEAAYAKIPQQRHQFRFQIHRPGTLSWKAEREWRLPQDLLLDTLDPESWWAFVPTTAEALWLRQQIHQPCRIVALTLLPRDAAPSSGPDDPHRVV